MDNLEEIKKDINRCRTYDFGMSYANRLAHERADKLVDALEYVLFYAKALDAVLPSTATSNITNSLRAGIEDALR